LALSKEALEEAFHRVIRRVHPDTLAKEEQSPAITASRLNEAYHRLLTPYTRAVALYERATGETLPITTTDPEILALAMDFQDLSPEERRDTLKELWANLLALEEVQDWPNFLKTLLYYRYCQDKV
jgi:curved DNA-binding protein CbpA